MKIAFLTTDNRDHYRNHESPAPQFGAAPEALLAGFTRRSDVEIHVISCTKRPLRSPAKLAANVFFHSLLVPRFGRMRALYTGCVLGVRRKLRELRPDIVHGQGTENDCALAAVFSGLPNVVTIHGNMAHLARVQGARVGSFGWLSARLEGLALPRTRGVFCNSAHTEELVRARARRTWRVPNALRDGFFNLPPAARPSAGRPVLLNIGVVCANKGQLALLTRAENWHRGGLDFELQFIGRADARVDGVPEFLARIEQASRAGFARHLETMDTRQLIQRLDQASALIHVAREESFGLVVAEALARNLKVLAFHAGGLPDIAVGTTGAELFAPGDWTALGDALTRWIRGGCEQPAMAAALMRERYHPDAIAARHVGIYREVLSTLA